MYDYIVGALGTSQFSVTKFGAGSFPANTYRVGMYGPMGQGESEWMTCSCPGGNHKDCKHRKMVRSYVQAHYPTLNVFWQGEDGKIYAHFTYVTTEWKAELERDQHNGRGAGTVGKRRAYSKRPTKRKRSR